MTAAKPRKGRPSKYRPEYVDQARKLAMLGLTNEEMAKFFEVGQTTFDRWMADKPEFRGAIKAAKELADADVVASLYHRAVGYEHPEDDIRAINGKIVITPTIKRYPPDPASMIFWLKNRQPARWRDKRDDEKGSEDVADALRDLIGRLPG